MRRAIRVPQRERRVERRLSRVRQQVRLQAQTVEGRRKIPLHRLGRSRRNRDAFEAAPPRIACFCPNAIKIPCAAVGREVALRALKGRCRNRNTHLELFVRPRPNPVLERNRTVRFNHKPKLARNPSLLLDEAREPRLALDVQLTPDDARLQIVLAAVYYTRRVDEEPNRPLRREAIVGDAL